MRYRETCGCKHDGRKWVEWCAAHQAEFDELHARAAAERANPGEPIEPQPVVP